MPVIQENGRDETAEMGSRLSSLQLDKVSGSSTPALKLPPLFSSTPNSSAKGPKRSNATQVNQTDTIIEKKNLEFSTSDSLTDNPALG